MKRERFYIKSPNQTFKAVYIAGKVTGREYEEARAQFDARAEELEALGWEVLNPMDFVDPGTGWQESMMICLHVLSFADFIDLLPGWTDSDGALLEFSLARKLGIKRFEL